MSKKIAGILIASAVLCLATIRYYGQLINYFTEHHIGIVSISYEMDGNEVYTVDFKDFDGNTVLPKEKEETVQALSLHALFSALIDGESGRVLYSKEGEERVPMASTTKIMTCIVALEQGNLDDEVTISKYASTMPDVQLNVIAGEKYKLKDLLYSLMLESHNDVAVAIAEHIGGSVEGFAVLMNDKARELGCTNTNFVTPNGLDAEGHYTTAVELSRIASYAIQNEDFLKITNTASYEIVELTKGRRFSVSNKDRFLYMYDGAIGVKTGFTNKAGYCFVGAVKKDDKVLVSSVLGSGWPPNKNFKWKDTLALMKHGMEDFFPNEVFDKEKSFKPIPVYNGKESTMDLYCEGEISTLMGKDEIVKVRYQLPIYLVAPVTAETIVGRATYYIGNDIVGEFPILTSQSVERLELADIWRQILNSWLGVYS